MRSPVSSYNLIISQNSEIALRVDKSDLESDYVPHMVYAGEEESETIRAAANRNNWIIWTRTTVVGKVPAISFHFLIVSSPKSVS